MTPLQWVDYHPWRGSFAEALDPRMYTLDYLDQRVKEGTVHVFTCDDAALLVEKRLYPTGAFDGHVLLEAGNPVSVVTLLRPQAEEWLRQAGALGAIVESRPAWARLLKPFGYYVYQVALRKEL